MPPLLLRCVAAAAAAAALAHGASSVVSNVLPRVDAATGETLDIHDGTTIAIDGIFYWYGASYGSCTEMASGCATVEVGACGFNLNHTVSLATSTDLVSWTLVGSVLPLANRPEGIMFSPTIARSAATGLFVLWVNILPVVDGKGDFDASFYSAFTAPTPVGPFVLANANVTGIAFTRLPDAPYLFVDDDGSAFVAFTHEDSHVNNVQVLTPDLLGPLAPAAVSAQIGAGNNEGVVMFKRRNLYYVGFGQCCCFCEGGTNVEFWFASSPLGPYTSAGQAITPAAWGAQTGAVWSTGPDTDRDFVLYGDRWQSAPDHIKAHDFSYMTPLSFADDGSVVEITQFQSNVTIRF